MKIEQSNEKMMGVASAASAYVLWGVLPLYWKQVQQVPSIEILAHRVVWSLLFMVLILLVTRKLRAFIGDLRVVLSKLKKFSVIIMASIFISVNWLTYIWAVNNNHIIETSLGYYINPLVSVLLGVVILKEKLSFWQIIAFFLALAGVLNMVVHFGSIPWVALVLAVSFGLYGLFKKIINLGAISGLTLETLMILPFALLYLNFLHNSGASSFGLHSPSVSGLLAGAGIVTAVPLILFAGGARRLPLSIVGFLQYIAPTIGLILGIFLYHEPFTGVHLVSFVFIWTALMIFSLARTKSFTALENLLLKKMAFQDKDSASG